MKLFITAVALLSVTSLLGCASAPRRTRYQGVCIHPAVNSGQQFKVSSDSEIDNGVLKLFFDGGDFVDLLGATCILKEEK